MSTATQPAPSRSRFGGASLVQTFGVGRVCSDEGCATILSRYNDAPVCDPHSEDPPRR